MDLKTKLASCGAVIAAGSSAQAALVTSTATTTAGSTGFADVDLNGGGREFTLTSNTGPTDARQGYYLKNLSNGFEYVTTGTGIANLPVGSVVSGASQFSANVDGDNQYFVRTNPAYGSFAANGSTQYFGFRFTNNGATNYGYASVQFDAAAPGGTSRVVGFSYDDAGAPVTVVPEPASLSLLALGAVGMLKRRNRVA